MEKTAIDWFYQRILSKDIESVFEQAKEMERIQIIDASASAYEDMFGANGNEYGENYYNKKFNN